MQFILGKIGRHLAACGSFRQPNIFLSPLKGSLCGLGGCFNYTVSAQQVT